MKRVVITGAGTINALGLNVPDTLTAMREGVCGIGPLAFRDVERLSIRIGGQVKGFEAEGRYNRQQISLYDRFTQFTLAAAAQAIAQSGLCFRANWLRNQAWCWARRGVASAHGTTITAPSMKRARTASTPLSCPS